MILNYITWWRYEQKFTSAKFRNSRHLRSLPSGLISMLLSCLLRTHHASWRPRFQNSFSSIRARFHVSISSRHRRNRGKLLQSYNNIGLKKRSPSLFGLFQLSTRKKVHLNLTLSWWSNEAMDSLVRILWPGLAMAYPLQPNMRPILKLKFRLTCVSFVCKLTLGKNQLPDHFVLCKIRHTASSGSLPYGYRNEARLWNMSLKPGFWQHY